MKHPLIISSDGKALGKQGVIARFIRSPAGRAQLAASMAAPIRRHLNYQGIARKVFHVEPLPQGALPYYDEDIDVASCLSDTVDDIKIAFKHNKLIINSNGKPGKESTLRGLARKVIFPSFEIVNSPSIRISDVKKRRFKVIDRAVQKAHQEIEVKVLSGAPKWKKIY